MRQGKVNIVIDGQAGSCGKGKTAAYLALKHRPDIVMANFGPNAGHTVWYNDHKIIFRHLPAGSVHEDARIYIGPAAAIDPEVLTQELELLERVGLDVAARLHIHPRAAVITKDDKDLEAVALQPIASTMKGVGSALARKVMRQASIAQNHAFLSRFTDHWHGRLLGMLADGARALAETSQGFDLCLNYGLSYPHCTSRQINTSQVLADFGVPPSLAGEVYGVIRRYPIRVGHIKRGEDVVGDSGPYAGDNYEISWEEVARRSGMDAGAVAELLQQELTTVTGRLRRVFTFSWERFSRFIEVNRPTQIVLNFADQISWDNRQARSFSNLSDQTQQFIYELDHIAGVPVTLVGVGPRHEDTIELATRPVHAREDR